MRLRSLGALAISAALVWTPACGAAQQCDAILKAGIYDFDHTVSRKYLSESFANWWKQLHYQTLAEARSASSNAVVPIGDVLVDLGFSVSDQGYQQFMDLLESYSTASTERRDSFDHMVQTINPGVVNAWANCVSQLGTHVWYARSDDPRTFFLYAVYHPDGSPGLPKLQSVTVSNAKTTGGPFMTAGGQGKATSITSAQIAQAFDIVDRSKPTTIVVNATRGSGLTVAIPARTPSVTFTASAPSVFVGDSVTLTWHVYGVDSYTVDGVPAADLPKGTVTVRPTATFTRHLYAFANGDQIDVPVSVTVNTPVLQSVVFTWSTTDNDKDWDTYPHISVRDKAGREVVEWGCCSSGRPDGSGEHDHWTNHTSHSEPVPPSGIKGGTITKADLDGGRIDASGKPGSSGRGHDDWHYTATVTMNFTDGTHITKTTPESCNNSGSNNTTSVSW